MVDPLLLRLGVLSNAQLESLGYGTARREAAIRSGSLVRLRPGWLARADADADVAAAVRAGGAVACASALRLHGAWVPHSLGRGHVRRSRWHGEVGGGCRAYGRLPSPKRAVDDLESAFRCVVRCGTHEDVIVIADSLLHRRLASAEELRRWLESAPARIRVLLDRVDAAESGTETMTRVRLRGRGVAVRTQVWIGRRRVDLVVGELLIIECDGAEHHRDWTAHEADRERDRVLTAQGYVVVRLTYRQIVDDWPAVEQDLLALIRRNAHRAPRQNST